MSFQTISKPRKITHLWKKKHLSNDQPIFLYVHQNFAPLQSFLKMSPPPVHWISSCSLPQEPYSSKGPFTTLNIQPIKWVLPTDFFYWIFKHAWRHILCTYYLPQKIRYYKCSLITITYHCHAFLTSFSTFTFYIF